MGEVAVRSKEVNEQVYVIVKNSAQEEIQALEANLHYLKEVEIYQVSKISQIVIMVSLKQGMVVRLSNLFTVIIHKEDKVVH